jgi:CheY-like chemotaxis protein
MREPEDGVRQNTDVGAMTMQKEAFASEAAMQARQRLRILIADDHHGTQRAVALLLRWLGCPAEVASDGREALEAVRAREYDVILMDVVMPRMDGLEATRRIRAERAPGSGPQIIGVSADTTAEDREICLAAGMDDFLPKPIDVDSLVGLLDEAALARAAVRREPSRESDHPSARQPDDHRSDRQHSLGARFARC